MIDTQFMPKQTISLPSPKPLASLEDVVILVVTCLAILGGATKLFLVLPGGFSLLGFLKAILPVLTFAIGAAVVFKWHGRLTKLRHIRWNKIVWPLIDYEKHLMAYTRFTITFARPSGYNAVYLEFAANGTTVSIIAPLSSITRESPSAEPTLAFNAPVWELVHIDGVHYSSDTKTWPVGWGDTISTNLDLYHPETWPQQPAVNQPSGSSAAVPA